MKSRNLVLLLSVGSLKATRNGRIAENKPGESAKATKFSASEAMAAELCYPKT